MEPRYKKDKKSGQESDNLLVSQFNKDKFSYK